MAQGLTRIPPIHPELVPLQDSEPAGMTHHGRQLWRKHYKMAKGVKKYEVDENGDEIRDRFGKRIRVFKKHNITGENVYPVNEAHFWDWDRLYYQESQGNGNIMVIDYTPPSPEELAARDRQQEAEKLVPALARLLVEKGVRVGNLTSRSVAEALGIPTDREEVTDEYLTPRESADETLFPKHYAPGRWELSDGTKMQGKKVDALEAEAALHQDDVEPF